MKRAAVVLGAGASYAVHNLSIPVLNPELKPPLARELFDARFWPYRQAYRGAEVLGAELGQLAQQKGPFNLEEKLTEFAQSEDLRTQALFKDIPPYLRDVLVRVTYEYVPSPTNYLRMVRRLLHDGSHQIAFISLNYDTLLERALALYDSNLQMTQLDDYVAADRQAIVVKVHGSTNWGVPMPGTNGRGSFDRILPQYDLSILVDQDPILHNGRDESRQWRGGPGDDFLYPRLTAPLREKTFVCPTAHTEALREFLSQCGKFLVVGCSGLDHDLLEFLDSSCEGYTDVRYVNYGGTQTSEVCQRFEAKVRAFTNNIPKLGGTPVMFAAGLTAYLDSTSLEDFLAAD